VTRHGQQAPRLGRRATDAAEGGSPIRTVQVWLAVLVTCCTIIVTGWRTAVSVGEKTGTASANMENLTKAVHNLDETTKGLRSDVSTLVLRVQHVEDTRPESRQSGDSARRSYPHSQLSPEGSRVQ